MGAPDFPRRPLADKFLYRALVRVNAYKCAKFHVSSSISYWDNEARRDLIVQKYDCIRKAEKGVAMFTQIGTKQQ